jgi:anti-sigma B factor antagonist
MTASPCETARPDRLEPAGVVSGSGVRLESFSGPAGACVLALHGEFDLYSSPELAYELTRVRGRAERRLVVDLTSATFIDGSTLQLLLHTLGAISAAGGELVLVGSDRPLKRLLEVTQLDRVFRVVETRAQALAA